MSFLSRAGRSANTSYAVGISVAVHLLFLNFLPVIQSKAPTVLQKKYVKVRIEIKEKVKPFNRINKKPVVQKQNQPTKQKKAHSITPINPASVRPIQNKVIKHVSTRTMKTTHVALNRAQVRPVPVKVSPVSSVSTVSSPTSKFNNSVGSRHNSRIKVTPVPFKSTTNKGSFSTPHVSIATSTNVVFAKPSPNIRPHVYKGSSIIKGTAPAKLVRGVNTKGYIARPFTPIARPTAEIQAFINNSATKEELGGIWNEYTSSIQLSIAKAKTYPPTARDNNQQGKAFLSFKLSKDGRVLDLVVVNSSGHEILDQAAIKAIKDAAPYPHIPEKLNKKYALLKIPISFVLR